MTTAPQHQPMKRYSTSDTVDVVVIGTGAGGAPILERLAKAGLSVVALEAGQWRDPAHQFAADEVAAADLYWLGDRLSAGETPTAFGGNNSGTGVGGSTLHWGAFVPRVDPRDLRLHTETGLSADWPLDFADLLPYYQEVERFIGVSGPADYPWEDGRTFPLGPVPLNAPAQAMQAGCAAIGVRTAEAPVATVSSNYQQPGYPERRACVACGYCHQGCAFGSKSSMDVTFIPSGVAAGAEIRPGSFVHTLEQDAHGNLTAVVYRSNGPKGVQDIRQPCKAVFLCAGAVETPRLLLHAGLANDSGQVGRNFMAHVSTQVWGTFAPEMRAHKGFPASLISLDMMRAPDADFAGGYIAQSLGIVPVTFAQQVARGRGLWGQPLVDYLTRYNHIAGIGINGDCLPYDRNLLELTDEVDQNGVPLPRVHFSYGENELRMSRHGARWMTEAWKAAGAKDVWTFERSAHTIGTCRMGTDPATSVVDPYGRSHQIPNLWICDNSVFPSAIAANPALTIMALALRTAEHFLQKR